MIKQIAMVATLGLILMMVATIPSQSYIKKASASSESCPAGQVKDWAGICFNKSEAKACPSCAPGSATAAEKPKSAAEKSEASAQVEANKEVEGTMIKQQHLGNSQIKVENKEIGADVLHTRESGHQQAAASQAKVEHASPPTSKEHTKFALLGNRHVGIEFEKSSISDMTAWVRCLLRQHEQYIFVNNFTGSISTDYHCACGL